jgi:hypothetical protein
VPPWGFKTARKTIRFELSNPNSLTVAKVKGIRDRSRGSKRLQSARDWHLFLFDFAIELFYKCADWIKKSCHLGSEKQP